jgi:hypothetical protein
MRDDLAPRDDPALGERRLWNRLTTIKLAIQMLDRKTELSAFQRGLVRTADEAIDGLIGELLERRRAQRGGDERPALRRGRAAGGPNGRAAGRRGLALGPAAAVALFTAVVLLFLLTMGAALLVPLLLGSLVGLLVAWLSRR